MIPADVLVKYPSLEQCPDKTYNHVGLYLGRDASSVQWLIESVGGIGVCLSTVSAFNAQGGIRRFTLTREPFLHEYTQGALAFGPLVPKFGRLGVRQYRKSGESRRAHTGLDLYAPVGTPVYATTDGIATSIYESIEDASGVEIRNERFIVRYMMLCNVVTPTGERVRVGDTLGHISPPSEKSDIVYTPTAGSTSHLHLEVELAIGASSERYANHLYLSKSGTLALPFRR